MKGILLRACSCQRLRLRGRPAWGHAAVCAACHLSFVTCHVSALHLRPGVPAPEADAARADHQHCEWAVRPRVWQHRVCRGAHVGSGQTGSNRVNQGQQGARRACRPGAQAGGVSVFLTLSGSPRPTRARRCWHHAFALLPGCEGQLRGGGARGTPDAAAVPNGGCAAWACDMAACSCGRPACHCQPVTAAAAAAHVSTAPVPLLHAGAPHMLVCVCCVAAGQCRVLGGCSG